MIAALTDPDSLRTYLTGVGLPTPAWQHWARGLTAPA